MVLLLNILVPVVVLGLMYLAYRLKKFWPIAASVAFVLLYQLAQPSYMPKGTVKPVKIVEFKQLDIPMVDRSLKPKSSEQYDIERNAALEAIDKSIKNQIKLNKE
jgi:hypothetical protein